MQFDTNIYQNKITVFERELSGLVLKSKITSYFRAFIFVSALIVLYLFRAENQFLLPGILIFIGLFLFLVKLNLKLKQKIKFAQAYILINKKENSAILGNFEIFHRGDEFINLEHPYSFDLDIFGEGSLFQYLNRTVTIQGKLKLAEKISIINTGKEGILKKQKADEKLANELDWRQLFLATAIATDEEFNKKINEKSNSALISIKNWAKTKNEFIQNPIFKILMFLLPGLTLTTICLYFFNIIPSLIIGVSAIINLSFMGFFLKKINREHAYTEGIKKSLHPTEKLLQLIEEKTFYADYLTELQTRLKTQDISAVEQINTLKKTFQALDIRLNILVGIVLNAFLLWDLHVLKNLDKLKHSIHVNIDNWFDVIGEFDALISSANFSFNNPVNTYPKISENDFYYELINGGHPLISAEKRIYNDFEIDGIQKFVIVTGANMAGKSTFLRTVSINMILGTAGTSVCAEKFTFSPIQIYTSIRTGDSLHKNESYFYAELMRLKTIIDSLNSGKKLFIILDEILKGTNSKDKHTGSKRLIEKLIKMNASGIIATHDIQLGALAEKYPKNISNNRFEVEIQDEELIFDYKLKTGISQNLNASFLMKKYKIIE